METRKKVFYFSYKINAQKICCFHRVMLNGSQPISARVVSYLFYKTLWKHRKFSERFFYNGRRKLSFRHISLSLSTLNICSATFILGEKRINLPFKPCYNYFLIIITISKSLKTKLMCAKRNIFVNSTNKEVRSIKVTQLVYHTSRLHRK